MDLFKHRYYRLGKILMSLIGQWPYQSTRTKCAVAILILPTAHQIVCQILALVKYRDDWEIVVRCLVSNVFEAVCATKYLGIMWNSQKTLRLLNRIRTDWQVWARDQEVNILHKYAERGKQITTVYTAMVYSNMVLYISQPMITKLIDVVLKNGTEPGMFPFPTVYHGVDEQKYYFPLNIYCTLLGLLVLTALVSSDVMLILYVHHVCAIFSAVGHKLERIGSNDILAETGEFPYLLGKTDMVYLVSCIDRHNDAIEYADLINASYTWNLFFTLGFGMILLNASGLQMLLSERDLEAIVECTVLISCALFYFYVECSISQMLIDHSISIHYYIHNSQWYRLSPKAQKLLQLMTMRCNVPNQLIAGNFVLISVKNFGLVIRTFMSYFAFIRSMQNL